MIHIGAGVKAAAASALLGFSLLVAAGPQATRAQEMTTLKIGHASRGSLSLVPGFLLEAKPEILEKHGIKAEWVDFSASPNSCVTSVVAGHTDICSTGLANTILAAIQGAKLRVVGAYSSPQVSIVMSKAAAEKKGVSPDAPLADRIEALKGISFARPPKGTTGFTTLALLLDGKGMSVDDFGKTYEMVDPSAMAAGVINGKWDAASWSAGPVMQAIVDGGGYLWITLPSDAPELSNFPSHVMNTSTDFADAHPDVVKALNAAIQEASAQLKDPGSGAVELIRTKFFPNMDEKLFDEAIKQVVAAATETSKISKAGFDKAVKFTQGGAPDRDFSKVSYEELIAPAARPAE